MLSFMQKKIEYCCFLQEAHHFEVFLQDFFGPDLVDCYYKNATARLEILKHFEMLKRKFNTGVKSRLQLSYLSEELS